MSSYKQYCHDIYDAVIHNVPVAIQRAAASG